MRSGLYFEPMISVADRSPKRLAACCGLGGLLFLLAGVLLCTVGPHYFPLRNGGWGGLASTSGALAVCVFLLAIGGAALSWKAESRLKEGLRLERWEAREVEALRRTLANPVWTIVFWAGTIAVVAAAFAGPRHSPVRAMIYFWLLPIQSIGRLRTALKEPRLPSVRIAWDEMKPIRSGQWGGGQAK